MTSGMEPQGVVLETPLQSRRWGWLVVFTTTSTLLCCALPIALVSLGLGVGIAPQLVIESSGLGRPPPTFAVHD